MCVISFVLVCLCFRPGCVITEHGTSPVEPFLHGVVNFVSFLKEAGNCNMFKDTLRFREQQIEDKGTNTQEMTPLHMYCMYVHAHKSNQIKSNLFV